MNQQKPQKIEEFFIFPIGHVGRMDQVFASELIQVFLLVYLFHGWQSQSNIYSTPQAACFFFRIARGNGRQPCSAVAVFTSLSPEIRKTSNQQDFFGTSLGMSIPILKAQRHHQRWTMRRKLVSWLLPPTCGQDGSEDGFPWQEGHLQLFWERSGEFWGILVTCLSKERYYDILYQNGH